MISPTNKPDFHFFLPEQKSSKKKQNPFCNVYYAIWRNLLSTWKVHFGWLFFTCLVTQRCDKILLVTWHITVLQRLKRFLWNEGLAHLATANEFVFLGDKALKLFSERLTFHVTQIEMLPLRYWEGWVGYRWILVCCKVLCLTAVKPSLCCL